MRSAISIFSAIILVILLSPALMRAEPIPIDPAGKLLPDRLGDFRAVGVATTPTPSLIPTNLSGFSSIASRLYLAGNGKKYRVNVVMTSSNSAAYAYFTALRRAAEQSGNVGGVDVGTAGFQMSDRLVFVKGTAVTVASADDSRRSPVEIAKALAATLDQGEGDIPVLIKHLPNWESVRDKVLFAIDKSVLSTAVENQPVLDALNFDGGAEAVVADYGGPKMVLVEFNTPQIASDNDQRITAKLQDLQNQGQPLPTAYRRVGNYSVFVFNADSYAVANELIDQVKYQQMVQWLGENPFKYDEAIREFSETTLGVFVNVVKASGLAILLTFGMGGLFGALLFTRRRAQQKSQEAYSDAGGMLRLNLDEITPPTDSQRLLGPGS